MKRDMNLIRTLLLRIEARGPDGVPWIEIEGHSSVEIAEHLRLMQEGGLVTDEMDTVEVREGNIRHTYVGPHGLTMAGYDFLDLARDENAWHEALGACEACGVGPSYEILRAILNARVMQSDSALAARYSR